MNRNIVMEYSTVGFKQLLTLLQITVEHLMLGDHTLIEVSKMDNYLEQYVDSVMEQQVYRDGIALNTSWIKRIFAKLSK